MSNSNEAALYYVEESTWGTTPGGPPTLNPVRRTGGSFGIGLQSTESAEVKPNRTTSEVRRTGLGPTGTIDFETSYGSHHDLMAAVFFSDWTSPVTTTDSLTVATGVFTMTGAFASLEEGDWFAVSGSASNDDYFRIATKSDSDNVTVEDISTATDEGPTGSVTISNGGILRPGTTRSSFTLEEQYTDVPSFIVYRGAFFGSITQNYNVNQIVTGSFGDVRCGVPTDGPSPVVERLGATVGDGSPSAVATTQPHSVVDSLFSKREGGLANNVLANSMSFTLNNNLRGVDALCHLGPAAINPGRIQVTGNYNGYFGSDAESLIDKMIADTASSQSFRVTDSAGNTEIWSFPQLKYTDGMPEMGGTDTDVPVNLQWTGYGDVPIQLDRFPGS